MRLSSPTEWWIQLLHSDRYAVQTAPMPVEFAQVLFLDKVDDTRCLQRQVLGVRVQKTAMVPQLQCSDNPVVQVVVQVSSKVPQFQVHRQS